MIHFRLWEILTETTDPRVATGAAFLAAEEAFQEVDLPLAEAEVLTAEETEATVKCLKPLAATAAKSAKFLLGLQTANLFIVVTVLKNWARAGKIAVEQIGPILDPPLRFRTKVMFSLMP